MSERRPLTEGLKPVDPALEKKFVFGGKAEPEPPIEKVAAPITRLPLTTRIRGDYAEALKRASLERQLSKTTPNTLQEMLEEALEPWLKAHGYLP
jgi:hypothetical protein